MFELQKLKYTHMFHCSRGMKAIINYIADMKEMGCIVVVAMGYLPTKVVYGA